MSDLNAAAADPAPEPVAAEPVATDPVEPAVEVEPGSESAAPETPVSATETVESPAEPEDPFSEFGGRETIEAAHRLYQASQTDDGLTQIFIEAAKGLGLSLKDIQSLFEGMAGPSDAEPEGPDPDEPITWAEFQRLQQEEQQRQAAAQAQAAQESARRAVQSAIKTLGLDPKDPSTELILRQGDKYVNGDFSPENILEAVRKGQADFLATVQETHKKYLATKETKAAVPSAPAGNPATPAPEPEPQNVAEAIKRTRAQWGMSS